MMGTLTASMLIPSKLNKPSIHDHNLSLIPSRSSRYPFKRTQPVMRLFGPAIFEASKLKVLFLGLDNEEKHPPKLPRTYTLTHSDITAKLTLAVSQTINNSQLQGWANKFYRDEVVAEWKKVKGKMSLHVHCHICGGHFFLELCAPLRYYIFYKELPVVLNAFVHGDEKLFNNYPELQEASVWVYFHSSIPKFNKVECWGPLKEAMDPTSKTKMMTMKNQQQEIQDVNDQEREREREENEEKKNCKIKWEMIEPCTEPCRCCYPPTSLIPWTPSHSITDADNQILKLPGSDLSIPSSGSR
ncbi:protein STAY-GREEN homolog, chloroplastic-like [Amaranthus tricolor]|uniref:protein STAY-GREEN homolog, chloroplastic-like n=1 Tax=Amaranthus tricolor TaxID=29722 RepID=UPI00258DD749|nr:protein STAY-GREEN homolog, chloroplastic-like [Amaranthus tricolor]